jgi:cytochrome c oxidase subunit 3
VFIVLEHTSKAWVPLHLPKILWLNTAILLTSSYTLEKSRPKLFGADFSGFRKLWRATTILGILFLAGQVIAWLQLVASGLYIASNQATSFFYIFTAAHAVHLLGGIAALLYVAMRDFEKGKISLQTAAKITSYYWHFMDGLWVFLLLLLYLGR